MHFLIELISGSRGSWLDPDYQELEPLFQKMAKQIRNDLHWAPKTGAPDYMSEPEFLHEALQRVIFNFLVEHAESQFMELEKHRKHRKIEPTPRRNAELMTDPGSRIRVSAGMKRSRSMTELLDTISS